MKQWVADIIHQKEVAAIPVMTHPGIEQNGNTVREAVSNGKVHADAVIKLTQNYQSVAACTIMDLTTEAEAFGAEIAFSDEAVPAVVGHMLTDAKSINDLQVPSLKAGRIPQYLKANLLAARAIQDRPVFAGCIGPFSLAGRLYDMSGIMMLIYENPDAAHTLLAKCTQFIEKLLSNDDCKAFSSAYVKYIVNKVQDDHFIVVLHNCGNTGHCTEAMVETGAAAYHFGNKCRMEEVIKEVPKDALAMGNLDPVSIFKDGTPTQMHEATLDLLEKMREYPNFVLSSGCDTPPHTPIENVNAFFEALNEWNEKNLKPET